MQQNINQDQWQPNLYEKTQAYQFDYGHDLIDGLLKPRKGEMILDLGCGTGQVTDELRQRGAEVVGIDASENMIARARENFPDIEFHVRDGADFCFPEKFDAIYSNATMHWIPEPSKAAACIHRSLKPGGRFVAQFSGKGSLKQVNEAMDEIMLKEKGVPYRIPLFLAGIGEYASILEVGGLEVVYAALLDHPTKLDGGEKGLANWVETFGHGFLPESTPEERRALIPLLEERLRDRLWKDGSWYVDYRRMRVVAFRKRA